MCVGTAVVEGPPRCRCGGSADCERRVPEATLRTVRLGGDAQPRAFTHSSQSRCGGADEMAKGIDCAESEPTIGSNRTTVLAGRVIRSLSAQSKSGRSD